MSKTPERRFLVLNGSGGDYPVVIGQCASLNEAQKAAERSAKVGTTPVYIAEIFESLEVVHREPEIKRYNTFKGVWGQEPKTQGVNTDV